MIWESRIHLVEVDLLLTGVDDLVRLTRYFRAVPRIGETIQVEVDGVLRRYRVDGVKHSTGYTQGEVGLEVYASGGDRIGA